MIAAVTHDVGVVALGVVVVLGVGLQLLANALRLVTTDASYRRRAGEVSALINQEDGAGVAAAAIERIGAGLPMDEG